jgi:hypothetical protein
LVDACCPNGCSERGECEMPFCTCKCANGFTLADCSGRTCPMHEAWTDKARAVDRAHEMAECSNMGLCERDEGICSCVLGFSGLACQRSKSAIN